MNRMAAVAVHLDVRFTFEIVGGKGRVRANVAGG